MNKVIIRVFNISKKLIFNLIKYSKNKINDKQVIM